MTYVQFVGMSRIFINKNLQPFVTSLVFVNETGKPFVLPIVFMNKYGMSVVVPFVYICKYHKSYPFSLVFTIVLYVSKLPQRKISYLQITLVIYYECVIAEVSRGKCKDLKLLSLK